MSFRRDYITKPIFSWARGVLPSMSDTEREALEAGDVWWDADLFTGDPDWSKLLAFPQAALTDEEKAFLNGPVDELCAMLDDWKINWEWRDLPPEAWDFIKAKKFFGMIIPKEHGGLGFSPYAHSEVVRKISTRSLAAAVTVMVPNSLGPGELLMRFGTKEQQERWLPRLADGRDIPCFGLTSPEAGSDAASMIDTGIICKGTFRRQARCWGCKPQLAQALHHARPRLDTAGPGLQGLRSRSSRRQRGRPRHHRGADPDPSARRRDRPSPSALDAGVPERPELGPRRLHPARLHHRRQGTAGPGLEDADDGARRRPRHFAAFALRRRRRLCRAHHRRLCPHPRAVRHFHLEIRGHRGAAGAHRGHGLSARCRATADLRRAECRASSRRHLRHHEAAGDRAHAHRDRRRHGHPWRQGRDRRAAELHGQSLSRGAGRHHGGGRQHPDPQSHRVRAGRDPRASLSARRDERAARERSRQGAGRLRQGVLETCRPQHHHAVPRLGPKLDVRRLHVRARCRRRRADSIASSRAMHRPSRSAPTWRCSRSAAR